MRVVPHVEAVNQLCPAHQLVGPHLALKRMERLPFSGLSANLRLISYRLSNLFGGIALPKIPTPSAGATKRPEVDISRAARNRQLVDLEGRRSWGVALHQLTCQKSHVDHIAASKMQGIRLS